MFKKETTKGLSKTLNRKEKAEDHRVDQRRVNQAKLTWKRTGFHPTTKTSTRGLSFQTGAKAIEKKESRQHNKKKPENTSSSAKEEHSSTASEKSSPTPKRLNQKKTFPTVIAELIRKSVQNRQSTLAKLLGSPVLINTIAKKTEGQKKTIQFSMESPPDKTTRNTKPSLKTLIQEIVFAYKSPEFQACVKFLQRTRLKYI